MSNHPGSQGEAIKQAAEKGKAGLKTWSNPNQSTTSMPSGVQLALWSCVVGCLDVESGEGKALFVRSDCADVPAKLQPCL